MLELLALLLFVQPAGSGWRDIMPGKNFKGWTRLHIPASEPLDAESQWKLDPEGRTVLCEGNRGHEWLRYDTELADFVFHAEWRFAKVEGEPRYNSGIFARTSADAAIWHQAQAGAGGGFLFGNTRVKGETQRFNLRAQMKENRVKPAGEWNTYEIRAEGPRIALSVNGAAVSELSGCEVLKGYIGLEAEGYRIEFRNLRLQRLR